MIVTSCLIKLHLPESHSLKDKRAVVRSLLKKLRQRLNVSVVELDARDLWQTAVLGAAVAARDSQDAQERLGAVERAVEEITLLKYIEFEPEFH